MKKVGAKRGTYGITRYAKSGLIIAFMIGYIALVSMSVVSAEKTQIDEINSNEVKQTEKGFVVNGKGTSLGDNSDSTSDDSELLEFALNNQEIFTSIGVICLALVFKVGLKVTESRAEQKWRSPEIDWLNYEWEPFLRNISIARIIAKIPVIRDIKKSITSKVESEPINFDNIDFSFTSVASTVSQSSPKQ